MSEQQAQSQAAPPRPTQRDDAVISAAVDKLLPRVMKWLNEDSASSESLDIREQLYEVVAHSCGNFDGYKLADQLDSQYCWSPDAELVDILDNFSSIIYQSHACAVCAWVKATAQVPRHVVGDRVTFTRRDGFTTITEPGEIVAVVLDTAQYHIRTAAQGGPKTVAIGKGAVTLPAPCWVVPWEDVVLRTVPEEKKS